MGPANYGDKRFLRRQNDGDKRFSVFLICHPFSRPVWAATSTGTGHRAVPASVRLPDASACARLAAGKSWRIGWFLPIRSINSSSVSCFGGRHNSTKRLGIWADHRLRSRTARRGYRVRHPGHASGSVRSARADRRSRPGCRIPAAWRRPPYRGRGGSTWWPDGG